MNITWHSGPVPPGLAVRQVYGYLLDHGGRVLLQDDLGRLNLPGGKPEPTDGNAVVTLVREVQEESQVVITSPTYLGYRKVEGIGFRDISGPPGTYAEVRILARIAEFLPPAPDPGTGRTYRRLLAPVARTPGHAAVHDELTAVRAAIRRAGFMGADDAVIADADLAGRAWPVLPGIYLASGDAAGWDLPHRPTVIYSLRRAPRTDYSLAHVDVREVHHRPFPYWTLPDPTGDLLHLTAEIRTSASHAQTVVHCALGLDRTAAVGLALLLPHTGGLEAAVTAYDRRGERRPRRDVLDLLAAYARL